MDVSPALIARVALGAVGLAVLLRGASLYRAVLWLSGLFTLGTATLVHWLLLATVGALCGAAAGVAIVPLVPPSPWSVAIAPVLALAAAVVTPRAYDAALPLLTPALGAAVLAAAADHLTPLVWGTLYVVGVMAQARRPSAEAT